MILNKSSIAFPQIYGPMENYTGVSYVIDMIKLKLRQMFF